MDVRRGGELPGTECPCAAGAGLDVRNNQVLSVTFTPTDTTAYTTATTTATINVRQATATGSNVGVNLAFNSPYLPDAVWVDVHNLAFWWVSDFKTEDPNI